MLYPNIITIKFLENDNNEYYFCDKLIAKTSDNYIDKKWIFKMNCIDNPKYIFSFSHENFHEYATVKSRLINGLKDFYTKKTNIFKTSNIDGLEFIKK